jgi:hypothetical protein
MMLAAVISLCDETGNMVRPWADAGYPCFCFDVKHSIRRPRQEGNITFLWGDARTVKRPVRGTIAAVFAFPPCTDVSGSGSRDWEKKGGMLLRDALEIFEACRQVCEWSDAPYMIENPVTYFASIPHIGKPQHYFEPWHYTAFELGDHYTKKTSLWTGNGFVMPSPAMVQDLGKPDDRIHKATPGADRTDFRSATPMGFARAVFTANSHSSKRQASCAA